MSLSNTSNITQYTGDGVTTTFGLTAGGNPMPYFDAADWTVNLFDTTANANVSPQPVRGGGGTYDYTVTTLTTDAVTGALTGNLVFNNALLGNHRLTAERDPAATSINGFTDNVKFPANALNAQLDRLTMLAQRALTVAGRSISRALSDPVGAPIVLPPDALLRGNYLGFDSASPANLTVFGPPAGTTAVSVAMAPVISAATLAAARSALGSGAAGDAVFTATSAAAIRQQLGLRELLTANRTYYVRTDGNDGNTGLVNNAGGAWLTLQHAANFIQQNLDLGNFAVIVQVGAGTYAAGVQMLSPFVAGGANAVAGVVFTGDTATPSNVVISASTLCFQASYGAKFAVQGFKLTTSAGDALYASAGGAIYVAGNMEFSTIPNTGAHMHVTVGGSITGTASYKISGGGNNHFFADRGGVIEYNSATITLVGTPAFAGAFAFGNDKGVLYNNGLIFSGAATGKRYFAQTGALIQTLGGGANYYPGNVAGTVDATTYGTYA